MAKNEKPAVKKAKLAYPEEVLEPVKEHLRTKLSGLEKRRRDVSAADPYKDKTRLEDNAAIDADAAEEVGHMQANAIKAALDRSIIQIRKALSMIRVGRYGVCERCGKMIDTDRLMIMPETTICVDCEKKKEK